ncbi:MAG: 2-amino-4-hydroxy-6-hydroxymethyldihydropteridine diphosphokinase [Chthonomonadales bacterium]|nr:2-amino-4-hydroxy-6-hydroxymethyldihydropteridine diphosphokinase [Chthonomonadales bacterium]
MPTNPYSSSELPPRRRVTTAYLGLGSNLGDRASHLRRALERLREACTPTAVSSLYETEFVGACADPQPAFLNSAVRVRTDLSPIELLFVVMGIEALGGRRETNGWQPRTIDIDILLYSDVTITSQTLTIPHPRMWVRAFVLRPLAEIEPDLLTPDGVRICDAAMALERSGQTAVRVSDCRWADQ